MPLRLIELQKVKVESADCQVVKHNPLSMPYLFCHLQGSGEKAKAAVKVAIRAVKGSEDTQCIGFARAPTNVARYVDRFFCFRDNSSIFFARGDEEGVEHSHAPLSIIGKR